MFVFTSLYNLYIIDAVIVIKGKYNKAKVFTNYLESSAQKQILSICDLEIFKDSKIRVMPDVHAGVGCPIGMTMTIGKYVVPNLVGLDIGCGVEVAILEQKEIDCAELDQVIRRNIPSGRNIHKNIVLNFPQLENLNSYNKITNLARIRHSIGTLGGGNHFIEVNKDNENNLYLVIHSGSRNLGKQVAEYYQRLANAKLKKKERAGEPSSVPSSLAYLDGNILSMYIEDMKICQDYATLNRQTMLSILVDKMSWKVKERFQTIHNYIDTDSKILRKGAVSANKGESLIIPINMREGSLICVGKGNADWNYSAPHGAGRLMSRRQAKAELSIDEFKKSMAGVYSTSISRCTLDEAPAAYKPIDQIIQEARDSIEVISKIKPIYNFKAVE